uniref:Uncharacterized protein n=1 Tax=Zea mays TaxID=4577 RepID=B6SJA6_MAIZE|nr:hypothetical protein [Zea mays]
MLPSSVGGRGRGRYLMLGVALALAALLALASASESDHKVRAHDSTTRPLPATDPSHCSHPSRLFARTALDLDRLVGRISRCWVGGAGPSLGVVLM